MAGCVATFCLVDEDLNARLWTNQSTLNACKMEQSYCDLKSVQLESVLQILYLVRVWDSAK
jgi:hypothetical protein